MMARKNGTMLWGIAALILCGSASQAWGQIEPIPPTTVTTGMPVDFFFPNVIPPNPDVKLLDFLGEAINTGTQTVRLEVMYDYLDALGNTVFVQPGGHIIAIPPGGFLSPVDPGPVILNFCPSQVSLHFNLLDVGEITVQGDYGHICFPVPEPGVWGLGLSALVLAAGRWQRHRRGRVHHTS